MTDTLTTIILILATGIPLVFFLGWLSYTYDKDDNKN